VCESSYRPGKKVKNRIEGERMRMSSVMRRNRPDLLEKIGWEPG
jgi:hypothetical protein